jgi:ribonuclease PH
MNTYLRKDSRKSDELRKVEIIPNYLEFANGSALMKIGSTEVLCSATIEEKVPPFLKNSEQGWLTSEYSMLPASGVTRTVREFGTLRHGRSIEIQRLIGRVLRSTLDLKQLKGKTIIVDCDVLQADGGTRTAAITGGFVAVVLALKKLKFNPLPIIRQVAAISAGMVYGELLLDLDFKEDSNADGDFNIIMDKNGDIIEIQGTGEKYPFKINDLVKIIELGYKGISKLFVAQDAAIK